MDYSTHYPYKSSPQSTYDITTEYRLHTATIPTNIYKLQENRSQVTEDTESAFAQTTIPNNINTTNIIFTNIILMTDKHNIPKGKMHSRLLPDHMYIKLHNKNNEESKHL